MSSVGSYEAKTHLPELLKRVERGERILITRRGAPVALLTQPPEEVSRRDVRQVVEEMLAYRDWQNRTTGGLTFRQMTEEGRRS
jgi:antitoxin (DNA-binding transcriptional repressor) of toxin-antitoxin stability system